MGMRNIEGETDILDEGAEHRDHNHQKDQLRARRAYAGREAAHRHFHNSRTRHGRTDDQRAAHDDNDVVGKAAEGVGGRDNAKGHGGQQGPDGDNIIAPAPGDEGHHHGADYDKGEDLGQGHRGSIVRGRSNTTQLGPWGKCKNRRAAPFDREPKSRLRAP
jgi:hypothetical protein